MCGIAGIFHYREAGPVDRSELEKISQSMILRGPDGFGEWFSQGRCAGFAHRRLSIIDLSDKASQPMQSADGRFVVTFNGEIYNYQTLREELIRKGRTFRSHSDTEVLLQLYEEKSEAMLDDLRGMFAFSIWDEKEKTLFAARDPYGIKPFYYADNGGTFRFASQVKALMAGGAIGSEISPAGLVSFFLMGYVLEPFTLYQKIRELPAGHFIKADRNGVSRPQPYFSVAKVFADARERAGSLSLQEIQNRVRMALQDSLKHHFVADVPVGIFLSSGIDSSALAGLAQDIGIQNLHAITMGYEEFRGTQRDEIPLAAAVASHYGMKHHVRMLSQKEFEQDFDRALEAMDQPSNDGLNTYFVSKAAKELGLKVVLSGLGGDELFGGYPAFKDVPKAARLLCGPSRIPALPELVRFGLSRLGAHPKAASLLEYGQDAAALYFLRRALFMPWELKQLMDSSLADQGMKELEILSYVRACMTPDPQTDFGRIAALEASIYMRNQLLRDSDWAGMAHSIEIRTPLVDRILLECLATRLVGSSKNKKHLLARSVGNPIPRAILKRKKTGFLMPLQKWQNDPKVRKDVLPPGFLSCHPKDMFRRYAHMIINRQSCFAGVLRNQISNF